MNRNCRRKTEKVYVKVNSDFDATGYMQPRQITWGDGRTYPIEQVRDFRPASTIADLPGDCYTVINKVRTRFNLRGIWILNRVIGIVVMLISVAGFIYTILGKTMY